MVAAKAKKLFKIVFGGGSPVEVFLLYDSFLNQLRIRGASNFRRKLQEQECIPVGCVQHAAVAVCLGRGVGVCLSACWDTPPRPGPGHPQGVGLETPLGVGLKTPLGQTPNLPHWVWAWRPPPTVDRILDTRFWKYYLAPISFRVVKIEEIGTRGKHASLTSAERSYIRRLTTSKEMQLKLAVRNRYSLLPNFYTF